jgi:hypothetical protein
MGNNVSLTPVIVPIPAEARPAYNRGDVQSSSVSARSANVSFGKNLIMNSVTSFSAKIACQSDKDWHQLSLNASLAGEMLHSEDVWKDNGPKLEQLGKDAVEQMKNSKQFLAELAKDPVMSGVEHARSFPAVKNFMGGVLKSLYKPLELNLLDTSGDAIGKNLKELVPSGCEIKR